MEGSWGDRQGYHHQMQRQQQVLAAVEAGWEGRPTEVRGAELQCHHQHAHFQQQHHFYHHLQQQQQQFEYC